MAARLKEKYTNEVFQALNEKFHYANVMEVPKLEKITLNMGLGDCKDNPKLLEMAVAEWPLSRARLRSSPSPENLSQTLS